MSALIHLPTVALKTSNVTVYHMVNVHEWLVLVFPLREKTFLHCGASGHILHTVHLKIH